MFSWKSTSSSRASIGEKETELDVEQIGEEEAELDVEQIARELKEMTSLLDGIEMKLQTGVPSCPRREVCDSELELHGSSNRSIRKLQSNANKLQNQLEELYDCSKIAKSSMIDLHHSLCKLESHIFNARRQTEGIESTKLQMDLDGGRCLQRYEYLRQLCLNWSEGHEDAKEMKRIFNGRVKKMHSKEAYRNERHKIFQELQETEAACVDAQEELVRQAKQMKGWVNVLMESEPLWNSMVSLVTTKTNMDELEEKLRYKRSHPSSQIYSSVSISSGWYDRMLHMIEQKSFLTRRL